MKRLTVLLILFSSLHLIGQKNLTVEDKRSFILENPALSTNDSLFFPTLFDDFSSLLFDVLCETGRSRTSPFLDSNLSIAIENGRTINYRTPEYEVLTSACEIFFSQLDQNYFATLVFKVDNRIRRLDFRSVDGQTFYVTNYSKRNATKKRWKLCGWMIMELTE